MPKPKIWTHRRNWSLVGKGAITAVRLGGRTPAIS